MKYDMMCRILARQADAGKMPCSTGRAEMQKGPRFMETRASYFADSCHFSGKNSTFCWSSSTLTPLASSKAPRSSSSASGSSMYRSTARRSGRAPNSGSYPLAIRYSRTSSEMVEAPASGRAGARAACPARYPRSTAGRSCPALSGSTTMMSSTRLMNSRLEERSSRFPAAFHRSFWFSEVGRRRRNRAEPLPC